MTRIWYIYILRSLKDGNHYVGMTTDLSRRLREHNSGNVRSTKARAPFILVHTEQQEDISAARAREKYFKSGAGRRWISTNLRLGVPRPPD